MSEERPEQGMRHGERAGEDRRTAGGSGIGATDEDRRPAGASENGGPGGPDRRTFLKRAGAAGAALGLGTIGAGEARADEGTADGGPVARTASPSAPYLHMQIPDVAVIGAGAFGAWTSYYLRRQGLEVTMVDKYGPANSKATSGGETRGVRAGYGDRDGPLWTRWANEAIRRWKEYDEEWKDRIAAPLFYTTGDLILREENENFLDDTRAYWDEVGVRYEVLTGDEVSHRWPAIETRDISIALHELDAGVVRARRAIETVASIFEDDGGRIRIAEARVGGRAERTLWDVDLDGGDRLRAGQFVFALGPWFPKAFPEIFGNRMRIPVGHVFYFGTPAGDHRFSWPNIPSYNVPGCTGWPALPPDNRGFRVRTGGSQHPDPDTSPRWVPEDKHERPRQILADFFPAMADAPVVETRSCHYELSVGRNFVIDRHPDFDNAWFAGCGSAEAFKFGPVTGEYVAMRVMGVDTDPEIDEGFRIPEEEYEDPSSNGWDVEG